MSGGYMGRMLFVDLSVGEIREETFKEILYQDFLGGYGIGARILFDRQKAKVDPLGSDAMLGFVTGLLTGTAAPFGSRYAVVGKSPLTRTWGDANSGGDFGPFLKFAGYDAVFFKGISPEPVYLLINNGKVELIMADKLWGRDTSETESLLKSEIGNDAHVACIGPSGEKLSLISCIINNAGRAAARSGLGAVMGAKKLKAIVVKGKQVVPITDESGLKEARKRHLSQLAEAVAKIYETFGTCGVMAQLVEIGDAPVKNWTGSVVDFPRAAAISDQSVIDLQERKSGCWRCPLACGGLMRASTGRYGNPTNTHKPEYETLAAFGSMCLNDNLESIIKVNDICNRYGVDTISAGSTIAFAIECYENGLINDRDTEDIELRWGNDQAIVAMTEKLAKREGFGEVLADGANVAARNIGKGAEEFAIHIHGQEVAMHDPRRFLQYTISYLDTTPGRHTQGNHAYNTASGLKFPSFDRKSIAGRGEANKMGSDLVHVVNSAGLCLLGIMVMDASAILDSVNLTTGWNYTMEDLLKVGERIGNMRQAFNIREGIGIGDFKVPGRVAGYPPLKTGPTAGKTVDVDTLRSDYLQARDWDTNSGKPSKRKLLELGLNDVAEVLWEE